MALANGGRQEVVVSVRSIANNCLWQVGYGRVWFGSAGEVVWGMVR